MKTLGSFPVDYDKVDFNVEVNDHHMKYFCEINDLKNLIKQPICYKNPSNLTCIDLILTNVLQMFQST